MAATAAAKAAKPITHYLVINSLGQSVHRRGAFESADAAREWVKNYYAGYPCWLLPVEYIGVPESKPLNKDGNTV